MKKKLLTAALLLGTFMYSNAQEIKTVPQHSANVGLAPIKAGNWMVGGSIGGLGYSFESEAFNIGVSPRAGYFIADGLALGAQASLGLRTVKDADNQWNYGIAPFVRYYIPRGASATGRFFGHGDVGITGSNAGKGTSFAFGVNAGYAHFITQTVALEVMAGYNYSKANVNVGEKATGLGVSLGFQIYLPGKNR
ncbi:hypothetical protein SAMN05660841_03608 [Sphingobacterium nematocida]|uniref:Outer membrane protein beta-barrel domain-containing protein n=1 Tax=Sphingobacterium nematocida TaxID=1513896 RepID=A0A1T5FXN3_9SPHI|nr:hypothetical protein [Sphingobacterium nematocida]SKC00814.1 hypothetical protein SAMN05660841_03608 [Sphingobacterium nematocida]